MFKIFWVILMVVKNPVLRKRVIRLKQKLIKPLSGWAKFCNEINIPFLFRISRYVKLRYRNFSVEKSAFLQPFVVYQS